MTKYLASFLLFTNMILTSNALSEEKLVESNQSYNPNVDCLILADENSIICKFDVIRDIVEQNIIINWINPVGEISRTREMVIPAGDNSAYDYRYIDGREEGKWNFKIVYNGKEYTSQFELK